MSIEGFEQDVTARKSSADPRDEQIAMLREAAAFAHETIKAWKEGEAVDVEPCFQRLGKALALAATARPEQHPSGDSQEQDDGWRPMRPVLAAILKNRHSPLDPHHVCALRERLGYPSDDELDDIILGRPAPPTRTEAQPEQDDRRLMACNKSGCDNVCSEYYSPRYGYLCSSCFERLVDTPWVDIAEWIGRTDVEPHEQDAWATLVGSEFGGAR